ncbi:MAG: glutamine--fructose-6-phosphate transaminase (isomerizing) [Candidatus Thioglobus sp.]|nr:glutamine--fructose-6-phosphate transaminase (isomerizing) [Candidatus Thioglobus sp.]
MCGIIGGVCKNNITPILIDGLKRLEYRGYDSAGVVVLGADKQLARARSVGKVVNLEDNITGKKRHLTGAIGIAHTRWATHGEPSSRNAHPHICNNSVSVVHNGIIENFLKLKTQQQKQGYNFTSDTDTEVIAHGIDQALQQDISLLEATQKMLKTLKGAYAIGVVSAKHPEHLIAARSGSVLVIGISKQGNFIASDPMALLDITNNFIYLEEGDIADICLDSISIYDENGKPVERQIKTSKLKPGQISKGDFAHFMHKEIFEQPQAIRDTLESRISKNSVLLAAFGPDSSAVFDKIQQVQIIACGTSYHAGLVAKYWLEDIAKIPCHIEVASEYRYRHPLILDDTLFVTISQSGETADTLEALKTVKKHQPNIHTLSICNSPESSLTRESELVFLTHAGVEIGVASTKAFTTQLVSLALLTVAIGKVKKTLNQAQEALIVDGLSRLPGLIEKTLKQENRIIKLAQTFKNKSNALFLGRGTMHAIAMEGALKLKEIR